MVGPSLVRGWLVICCHLGPLSHTTALYLLLPHLVGKSLSYPLQFFYYRVTCFHRPQLLPISPCPTSSFLLSPVSPFTSTGSHLFILPSHPPHIYHKYYYLLHLFIYPFYLINLSILSLLYYNFTTTSYLFISNKIK